MASRTPPLVLQALAPFRLGPAHLLATGQRLEVQQGPGLIALLADLDEDEQRRRFGRVLLRVVTDHDDQTAGSTL